MQKQLVGHVHLAGHMPPSPELPLTERYMKVCFVVAHLHTQALLDNAVLSQY